MTEVINDWNKPGIFWTAILGLLLAAFGGCSKPAKIFTVGIVNCVSIHDPCLNGLKAGMTELGYVESENICYIYSGPVEPKQEYIDVELKKLLSRRIDLLFTTGNEVTLRAKKVLDGTGIPIVIGASNMIVEQGIVESLTHHGNLTGVQAVDTLAKALEWLTVIAPGTKKVYLPYNPDDVISSVNVKHLLNSNPKPVVELIIRKVHSIEETTSDIRKLHGDVNAVFRIPSPTLDPKNSELNQAAIVRGLPVVSALPPDEDSLISFGSDFFSMGRQAARLVHQIHLGAKAADLPVEMSEAFLTINLKTAKRIGLNISDDVLFQAKTIIH